MLKTKRSDALVRVLNVSLALILILMYQVDAAKRRKELLGNIISTASTPQSLTPVLDGDIFDVESDPLPHEAHSAAPSSPQKTVESSRSKTVSGMNWFLFIFLSIFDLTDVLCQTS
jgi:hypothetical protein